MAVMVPPLERGNNVSGNRVFDISEEYEIETHADGVEYLRIVEVIRDESGVMHSEELIEEVPLREWIAAGGVLPSGVWR